MLVAMNRSRSLRLVRALYSLALYLALPAILYHLIWRGFRYRDYLRRWPERFGFFEPPSSADRPTIWLHAVSVGEVNAATALVEALFARYPDHRIALTCFTPTASERIQALWGDRVWHGYAPYDLPDAVARFLNRLRPSLAIIMETEIWPNLYLGCAARGIPLAIANARLSARSLHGYRPVRRIMAGILETAAVVAAQSELDAERLRSLGARGEAVAAVGNLKYDMEVPPQLFVRAVQRRARIGTRPVWIAASTHADEESAVLAIHRRVLASHGNALLLWAPRHPERFAPVIGQVRATGWRIRVRSSDGEPDAACGCFVVDSLGELLDFYACADVAFVGGSVQPVGGHNVLEPAALAVPVVVGPHMFNFAEVAELLEAAGGLRRLPDIAALTDAVLGLLDDPVARHAMGHAGAALVATQRGAVARTLDRITDCYRPIGADRRP